MCKKVFFNISGILLAISSFTVAHGAVSTQTASKDTVTKTDSGTNGELDFVGGTTASVPSDLYDSSNLYYALTIRAAHERLRRRSKGIQYHEKNCSAIVFNPILTAGNWTFDGDFYYGRQFKNGGTLRGERHFSKLVSADKHKDFFDDFENSEFKSKMLSDFTDNIGKAHFYRNYTRVMYENKADNYRVVIGDTFVRSTIGFQQMFSGGGISIFRQEGNGETVDSGLPILITRVSKVECMLGDEVVGRFDLAPGLYSLDDLPPEAKMAGVQLKITDQTGRSEKLDIDYFPDDHLSKGKDDFDITVAFRHKWKVEDPHRIRYYSKPRLSTNYRYGVNDVVTAAVGLQGMSRALVLDGSLIFNTEYGRITPNVAISKVNYSKNDKKNHSYDPNIEGSEELCINRNSRTALGAGLFYAAPKNDLGLHFETSFNIRGKGFSDFRFASESQLMYNRFIENYFLDVGPVSGISKADYKNSLSEESAKQLVTRVYTDPIGGFVPSVVFAGTWTKSEKLREFSLSLTKTIKGCAFTVSWGITYDAPHGGRNGKAKDRRFLLACSIPFNSELALASTYKTYADEKKTASATLTYTPEAVKGLTLEVERYKGIANDNPVASIKYEGDSFDIKAENNIVNTNRHSETDFNHANQYRMYFGTSLTNQGFKRNKVGGFNIIKTARPKPKSEKKEEEKPEYLLD